MPNAPQSNNDPGGLKFAGQAGATPSPAGFAKFSSPEEGYTALLNDVQAKINKNPKETLEQFSDTYAPEDDGNDPIAYTEKLANQLGVPPTTSIGTLEPQIGKFADAIANDEGYTANQESGVNGIGAPVAATAAGVGLGGAAAAALGGGEVLGEEALGGVEGLIKKIPGISSLFGGGQSTASTSTDAAPPQTTVPVTLPQGQQAPETGTSKSTSQSAGVSGLVGSPLADSYATPNNPSDLYNSLNNVAGSTVSGRKILQEGIRRGIDPVAAAEMSGVISAIQPDENGDYNREAGVDFQDRKIAEDKSVQRAMVNTMNTPTDIEELRKKAKAHVARAMADTGESERGLKEVDRIFDNYRSELPRGVDEQGKPRIESTLISPARLQKKKELLSVNERDFARPQHERDAAVHIKEVMRKELSEIAKKEGVKGWDETNKRMEANILVKKLIKAFPKKAARDIRKEFGKDLLASVAGGLVAKTLGANSLTGNIAGYLIQRQLGSKEYKPLGTKEARQEAERKGKTPQKGLLSKDKNNFLALPPGPITTPYKDTSGNIRKIPGVNTPKVHPLLALPPGRPLGTVGNPHIVPLRDTSSARSVTAKKRLPQAHPKTGRMQRVYSSTS
jgi:hypothetical protein